MYYLARDFLRRTSGARVTLTPDAAWASEVRERQANALEDLAEAIRAAEHAAALPREPGVVTAGEAALLRQLAARLPRG